MSQIPSSEPASLAPVIVRSLVAERLTVEAFASLAGNLAGYPFVKVVVDRGKSHGAAAPGLTTVAGDAAPLQKVRTTSRSDVQIHFINHAQYQFHSDYIAENILGIPPKELDQSIDEFNRGVYLSANDDRRFFLGTLALHVESGGSVARSDARKSGEPRFFSLETVEVDTMDAAMLREFYDVVKANVDPGQPILFKPANHQQEAYMRAIPPAELPRVFSHELFSTARFIALNPGATRGRLRAFRSEEEYKRAATSIEWFDIIVMHRVPDDIPRISGIINAHHTTPLSHTNVLASGWGIPNSIQLGIFDQIDKQALDGRWVSYVVEANGTAITLDPVSQPVEVAARPAWSVHRIQLEEPETAHTPIVALDALRMGDRYRYGTKAANLGELKHVLEHGSERLLGFYKVRRPPRNNLLPYLAAYLGLPETAVPSTLARAAWQFLRDSTRIPRGIAIPFAVQQEFLESSPRIQQAIGKLKMALELDAREIDPLCLNLQTMIRQTRFSDALRARIDTEIADTLGGVSSFVIRSSSNAEDLEGFSAAGIYESINHVTTAENIFQSIKEVWASLLSPRSVRLRRDVGISLDDCYMGVIVQEEVPSEMGGVLVTTNPMNRNGDFRNVYINASAKSVVDVVQGSGLPIQYLYNTVEGGGRTLSIGDAVADLSEEQRAQLQKLAFAGRLLQSHFSPDYTFSTPMDVEWLASSTPGSDGLYILQLRPYAK